MVRIHHSQIAAAANVSRSTVSRALQNHPSLPAETRRRIQDLAREMGYCPNPLISALMATRNHPRSSPSAATLAVLTAWHPTTQIAPLPSDRRYLTGAKQRADELGFQFEEFWLNEPGLSLHRLGQILVNRGIVAVLVAPIPLDQPKIDLKWEHFSLAAFAPSPQIPVLHQASQFHFRSSCLAVRELIKRGYRRPALMTPYPELTSNVRDQWTGGYLATTLNLLPAVDRLQPVIQKELSKDFVARWCRTHRPDVILSNDTLILGWLREAGLDKSVAFANLDHHPDQPEMAGIDQMHELIGAAAVDIIVGQFNRNERGIPAHPRDVLIEGEWIDGPSAPRIGSPAKPA
jgi:LacI family transcriptional regulator